MGLPAARARTRCQPDRPCWPKGRRHLVLALARVELVVEELEAPHLLGLAQVAPLLGRDAERRANPEEAAHHLASLDLAGEDLLPVGRERLEGEAVPDRDGAGG